MKIENVNKARLLAIKKEMKLHGCVEHDTPFFMTTEFENTALEIVKNKATYLDPNEINLPHRSNEEVQKRAKEELIKQIGDIDQKVLYIDKNKSIIEEFEKEHKIIDASNEDEFIKYMLDHSESINVTDLPIEWKQGKARAASSLTTTLDDSMELLEKFPIVSRGIIMQNQNDDFGSTVLTHEMVHALLNRYKGNIRNVFNREVLSIYMELVTAYEMDESGHLLNTELLLRLHNLKGEVLDFYRDSHYGVLPNQIHLYSSFCAFGLFEKYRKASDKVRNIIRKEINEVFLGNRTLEDTLEKLDVTQEEGSQVIQEYVKKLMK